MASKKTLILVIISLISSIFISISLSRPLDNELTMLKRHKEWMAMHGRVYLDTKEQEKRYTIFKNNVERIDYLNNNVPERKFKLSVNQFADLTNEEFRSIHTGYKGKDSSEEVIHGEKTSFRYENVSLSSLPISLDWRKNGAITPIKNQATCGCCWAFSVVAAIEGITKIKKGKLISLSEQQLVDCDTTDYGCEGGLLDTAFEHIKENGGLTTEVNYPYKGEDGICNTKKASTKAAIITGYEDVPINDETALMKVVTNQPVSVAIEGGGFDFQFYSSGVFTGECGIDLDHAVAAVGYGESDDGTKYWIIKNSWGEKWGEKGYMRIKKDVKNKEGLCGIAMKASYPTL